MAIFFFNVKKIKSIKSTIPNTAIDTNSIDLPHAHPHPTRPPPPTTPEKQNMTLIAKLFEF